MIRRCCVCGRDISARGTRAFRCAECQKAYERRMAQIRRGYIRCDIFVNKLPERCMKCKYSVLIHGHENNGVCGFLEITGMSRLRLHEGENVDINNPCREFSPKEEPTDAVE